MFAGITFRTFVERGNHFWRQLQKPRETFICHSQFTLSTHPVKKCFSVSQATLKMAPVLGELTNVPTDGPTTPSKKAKLDLPNNVTLKFAKLTENATVPKRGSTQAAGFDLCSAYEYAIPAGGKVCAKTDLQIALPDGCYGRVAPRSGLAVKHFIDVGAGVIDQDYRGNVGVVLFNFGTEEFKVAKGDRIAQLILERIYVPDLEELPTLDETERGAGGFGSTGTN